MRNSLIALCLLAAGLSSVGCAARHTVVASWYFVSARTCGEAGADQVTVTAVGGYVQCGDNQATCQVGCQSGSSGSTVSINVDDSVTQLTFTAGRYKATTSVDRDTRSLNVQLE